MLDKDLNGSLCDVLLNSLRSQAPDSIIQTNGLTGEKTTVRQLLSRGISVAEGLRKLGLVPDDLVAVVANYSRNSIDACLGGLLQGLAVYPMDPHLRQLELEHMFRHAQPKLVFVESRTALAACKALRTLGNEGPIYVLDDDNITEVQKQFKVFRFDEILFSVDIDAFKTPHIENPKERIAVVIPSSGTTGLSKGVKITHRAALFQFITWENFPAIRDCHAILQLTPLFWVSGFAIFLMSCVFGFPRVYLAKINSTAVLKTIQAQKPVWSVMAPIYLAWVLEDLDFKKYDLSSMKVLGVGGSVLPEVTIKMVQEKWPQLQIFQGYGASEIGGLATNPLVYGDIYSAGTPQERMKFKIVSTSTGEELGTGKEGEILIKCDDVMMKGYLNDEESTRSAIDGNGFYHTGDIGYLNESNFLYITGRIKELIKVKNHQVSPYEIEEVIRLIPSVKDVGVVGVPHEIDQYHPRALVVKMPESKLTEKDIVDIVADKLSESKHLFGGAQFVEDVPRNPSGKIKRSALLPLVQME